MSNELSRRDLMRSLAAGGLAAAAGSLLPSSSLADEGTGTAVKVAPAPAGPREPATVADGKVIQPRRELPVLRRTDVLVIGGGPAGVTAALAARRLGVDVTLVERYGHLGGLCTGGLVLLVYPMFSKDKQQVVRGIGEEMLQRLDKLDRGIMNRRPGVNPTVDAEAFKYVLVDMVMESGMNAYLHCWGVDAIVDAGGAVRGAVVESKSGRQAILSDVVVDASGDGDIYAAAGATFEKVKYDIGLVSRIGNIDRVKTASEPAGQPASQPKKPPVGTPTPVPGVNWVNMRGPVADGLDVAELTRLELNHRVQIWRNVEKVRKTPGYEQAYLVETAPQLGVRLTRLLEGVRKLTYQEVRNGQKFDDVIGYGGVDSGIANPWAIPYACLVPAKLENVLATGRCVSADFKIADVLRLIASCFLTGHAAGVAAGLCVKDKCAPRNVDIAKLQRELRQQGAYLG
jgi:hypothetical protein